MPPQPTDPPDPADPTQPVDTPPADPSVGRLIVENFRRIYGDVGDREVAVAAGVASADTVQKWLRGHEPKVKMLLRLALSARCLVDDLLTGASRDYDVLRVHLRNTDPKGKIMGDRQIDLVVNMMLEMDKEGRDRAVKAVSAVLAGGTAGPQSGGEGISRTGT